MGKTGHPPKWEQAFLAALRAGESLAGAARVAGIHRTTPRLHAGRDARFAAEMAFARTAPRNAGPSAIRPQRKIATRIELFLASLAETSNVAAAADSAELSTATIYKLRREDPEFARRWYAALAEGYDNLEIELLGRLRAGEDGETAKDKRKFDTAAALRCLAAHRESVAREKGRRALAEEVTTIESINAKIDKLRLAGEESEAAIAAARRAKKLEARKTARALPAPKGGGDA